MSSLAIIPARGVSKQTHRKKCKFFLGRPIVAYSIEAVIKSSFFMGRLPKLQQLLKQKHHFNK